jgi:hypothetical protein
MGVVDTSTSRGRKFCIRSSFGVHTRSLERSSQRKHISCNLLSAIGDMLGIKEPKKIRLGPQKGLGNLGPEKP